MGITTFIIYMLLVISACINSSTETTSAVSSATTTGTTGGSTFSGATDSTTSESTTDSSTSLGATDSTTSGGTTDSSTSLGATDSTTSGGTTSGSTSLGATDSTTPGGTTGGSTPLGATDSTTSGGTTGGSTTLGATDSTTSGGTTGGSTSLGATDSTTSGGTTGGSTSLGATDSTASGGTTDSAVSSGTESSSPDSTPPSATPSPSTPAPTTQAPAASTSFPVKKPSLDGAMYELRFTVIITAAYADAELAIGNITDEYKKAFSGVKGFSTVTFVPINPNTSRRKRAAESTITDGTMLFNASDVYTTNESSTQEWGQNLKASFASVPKNIDSVKVEPESNYETLVNELVTKVGNPCEAVGTDVCSFNQICDKDKQLCYHRCEFLKCGEHGECQVVGIDENSIQAKCQCSSDGLYDYSGDDCRTEVMNWVYILVITCSVGGGIILILAVAVICCCIRKRRAPKTERSLLDGYSEGGHDISLQDFSQRRSLVNPRFKSDYSNMAHSNEGYQPDSYDPYFYQSDNRSWLHSPEANAAMEKQYRAEKSFKSGFSNIDTDRSYAIKRPQVSPRAVGDDQL